MNGETLLDPELRPFLLDGAGFNLHAGNLADVRAAVEQSFGQLGMVGDAPRIVDIPRPGGGPPVQLRIHTPATSGPQPAIYNIHGGGYVLGSAASNDGLNRQLATETASVVVSVDYRLAPETPFPGPVEDCYAGLHWLFENAAALGVDGRRITSWATAPAGVLPPRQRFSRATGGSFCPRASC